MFVGQMGPQPYRIGAAVAARKASAALHRWLRLELGMQLFGSSIATPNPSIERTHNGMPRLAFTSFWAKRVLPLRAAHVKR